MTYKASLLSQALAEAEGQEDKGEEGSLRDALISEGYNLGPEKEERQKDEDPYAGRPANTLVDGEQLTAEVTPESYIQRTFDQTKMGNDQKNVKAMIVGGLSPRDFNDEDALSASKWAESKADELAQLKQDKFGSYGTTDFNELGVLDQPIYNDSMSENNRASLEAIFRQVSIAFKADPDWLEKHYEILERNHNLSVSSWEEYDKHIADPENNKMPELHRLGRGLRETGLDGNLMDANIGEFGNAMSRSFVKYGSFNLGKKLFEWTNDTSPIIRGSDRALLDRQEKYDQAEASAFVPYMNHMAGFDRMPGVGDPGFWEKAGEFSGVLMTFSAPGTGLGTSAVNVNSRLGVRMVGPGALVTELGRTGIQKLVGKFGPKQPIVPYGSTIGNAGKSTAGSRLKDRAIGNLSAGASWSLAMQNDGISGLEELDEDYWVNTIKQETGQLLVDSATFVGVGEAVHQISKATAPITNRIFYRVTNKIRTPEQFDAYLAGVNTRSANRLRENFRNMSKEQQAQAMEDDAFMSLVSALAKKNGVPIRSYKDSDGRFKFDVLSPRLWTEMFPAIRAQMGDIGARFAGKMPKQKVTKEPKKAKQYEDSSVKKTEQLAVKTGKDVENTTGPKPVEPPSKPKDQVDPGLNFVSGVEKSPADGASAIAGGGSVGHRINEPLTSTAKTQIVDLTKGGRKVFLEHGLYKGTLMAEAEGDSFITLQERMSELVQLGAVPENLMIVLPDALDNPIDTTRLATEAFFQYRKSDALKDANYIFPLQRSGPGGAFSVESLPSMDDPQWDGQNLTIGIPANLSRIRPDELRQLLMESFKSENLSKYYNRFHLLGVDPGSNRGKELIAIIRDEIPDAIISADTALGRTSVNAVKKENMEDAENNAELGDFDSEQGGADFTDWVDEIWSAKPKAEGWTKDEIDKLAELVSLSPSETQDVRELLQQDFSLYDIEEELGVELAPDSHGGINKFAMKEILMLLYPKTTRGKWIQQQTAKGSNDDTPSDPSIVEPDEIDRTKYAPTQSAGPVNLSFTSTPEYAKLKLEDQKLAYETEQILNFYLDKNFFGGQKGQLLFNLVSESFPMFAQRALPNALDERAIKSLYMIDVVGLAQKFLEKMIKKSGADVTDTDPKIEDPAEIKKTRQENDSGKMVALRVNKEDSTSVVIHRSTEEGKGPWRITRYTMPNDELNPSGHMYYNSLAEALQEAKWGQTPGPNNESIPELERLNDLKSGDPRAQINLLMKFQEALVAQGKERTAFQTEYIYHSKEEIPEYIEYKERVAIDGAAGQEFLYLTETPLHLSNMANTELTPISISAEEEVYNDVADMILQTGTNVFDPEVQIQGVNKVYVTDESGVFKNADKEVILDKAGLVIEMHYAELEDGTLFEWSITGPTFGVSKPPVKIATRKHKRESLRARSLEQAKNKFIEEIAIPFLEKKLSEKSSNSSAPFTNLDSLSNKIIATIEQFIADPYGRNVPISDNKKADTIYRSIKKKKSTKSLGDALYQVDILTKKEKDSLNSIKSKDARAGGQFSAIETDNFSLTERSQVTKKDSDTGYLLKDKNEVKEPIEPFAKSLELQKQAVKHIYLESRGTLETISAEVQEKVDDILRKLGMDISSASGELITALIDRLESESTRGVAGSALGPDDVNQPKPNYMSAKEIDSLVKKISSTKKNKYKTPEFASELLVFVVPPRGPVNYKKNQLLKLLQKIDSLSRADEAKNRDESEEALRKSIVDKKEDFPELIAETEEIMTQLGDPEISKLIDDAGLDEAFFQIMKTPGWVKNLEVARDKYLRLKKSHDDIKQEEPKWDNIPEPIPAPDKNKRPGHFTKAQILKEQKAYMKDALAKAREQVPSDPYAGLSESERQKLNQYLKTNDYEVKSSTEIKKPDHARIGDKMAFDMSQQQFIKELWSSGKLPYIILQVPYDGVFRITNSLNAINDFSSKLGSPSTLPGLKMATGPSFVKNPSKGPTIRPLKSKGLNDLIKKFVYPGFKVESKDQEKENEKIKKFGKPFVFGPNIIGATDYHQLLVIPGKLKGAVTHDDAFYDRILSQIPGIGSTALDLPESTTIFNFVPMDTMINWARGATASDFKSAKNTIEPMTRAVIHRGTDDQLAIRVGGTGSVQFSSANHNEEAQDLLAFQPSHLGKVVEAGQLLGATQIEVRSPTGVGAYGKLDETKPHPVGLFIFRDDKNKILGYVLQMPLMMEHGQITGYGPMSKLLKSSTYRDNIDRNWPWIHHAETYLEDWNNNFHTTTASIQTKGAKIIDRIVEDAFAQKAIDNSDRFIDLKTTRHLFRVFAHGHSNEYHEIRKYSPTNFKELVDLWDMGWNDAMLTAYLTIGKQQAQAQQNGILALQDTIDVAREQFKNDPINRDLLAGGFLRDMEKSGSATQLIGQEIPDIKTEAGQEAFVKMAQILRSPHFEYGHLIGVKDGKIVRASTVSARISWCTATKPGKTDAQQIEFKRKFSVGMDYVFSVHNHPSGDVTPSVADLEVETADSDQNGNHVCAIVINHGKYAVVQRKEPGSKEQGYISGRVDEIANQVDMDLLPGIPARIIGKTMSFSNDGSGNSNVIPMVTKINDFLKDVNGVGPDGRGSGYLAFHTDPYAKILAVQLHRVDDNFNVEEFYEKIKDDSVRFGTYSVAVYSPYPNSVAEENFKKQFDLGVSLLASSGKISAFVNGVELNQSAGDPELQSAQNLSEDRINEFRSQGAKMVMSSGPESTYMHKSGGIILPDGSFVKKHTEHNIDLFDWVQNNPKNSFAQKMKEAERLHNERYSEEQGFNWLENSLRMGAIRVARDVPNSKNIYIESRREIPRRLKRELIDQAMMAGNTLIQDRGSNQKTLYQPSGSDNEPRMMMSSTASQDDEDFAWDYWEDPLERLGGTTSELVDSAIEYIMPDGTKVITQINLAPIPPIPMPEVVELIKNVTGKVPKIGQIGRKTAGTTTFGYFMSSPNDPHIKINKDIFASKSDQAVKTLMHEWAHNMDFLDDETMSRGNLLGRITSRVNFKGQQVPAFIGGAGQTLIIKPKERARIRRDVRKQVMAEIAKEAYDLSVVMGIDVDLNVSDKKVIEAYANMLATKAQPVTLLRGPEERKQLDILEARVKKVSRQRYVAQLAEMVARAGLAGDVQVRAELLALMDWWKPIPETSPPDYQAYRAKGEELYADAVSLLFLAPNELQKRCPIFWQSFFLYLKNKPKVEQALREMWSLIRDKGLVGISLRRMTNRRAKYKSLEQQFIQQDIDQRQGYESFKGYKRVMQVEHYDYAYGVIKRTQDAKAKYPRGSDGSDMLYNWATDPEAIWGSHPFSNNPVFLFLDRVHRNIVSRLPADGLNVEYLGDYLFMTRVIEETNERGTGRSQIANPGGNTAKTAQKDLLNLRKYLGPNKFAKLNNYAQKLRDMFFDIYKEAYDYGLFTPKQFKIIESNKNNYATFANVDHFFAKDDNERSGYIPAGIREQVGSFGEIINPMTSLVIKACCAIKVIEWQRAKLASIELMENYFPDEITELDHRFVFDRNIEARIKKYDEAKEARINIDNYTDDGIITIKRNGKIFKYVVPWDVAIADTAYDPASADAIIRAINWAFRKLFYPVFITHNPFFQLISSPKKDLAKTAMNMPNQISRYRLLKSWRSEWKQARDRIEGKVTPLIAEMMSVGAIGTPYDNLAERAYDTPDSIFSLLMEKHQLAPSASKFKIPEKLMKIINYAGLGLLKKVLYWGQVFESVAKIGPYKVLTRDLGVPPSEAGEYVRNHAGVPPFWRKGTKGYISQAILPFFNVAMKGFMTDLKLMRGKREGLLVLKDRKRTALLGPLSGGSGGGGIVPPDFGTPPSADDPSHGGRPKGKRERVKNSGAGYWFRYGRTVGIDTLLKNLAKAGLLGEGIRSFYDYVPEYDGNHYGIMPLGYTYVDDNNETKFTSFMNDKIPVGAKAIYPRIPRDETHNLLSGIQSRITMEGLALITGDTSLHDENVGFNTFNFAQQQVPGLNPAIDLPIKWWQFLSGQNPRNDYRGTNVLSQAEHDARTWPAWEKMFAYTLEESGLSSFVRFDTETDTTLEFNLKNLPGVNATLGRLIKVTDQGLVEKGYKAEDLRRQRYAKIRVSHGRETDKLLTERNRLLRLSEENRLDVPGAQNRFMQLQLWFNTSYAPFWENMKKYADYMENPDLTKSTIQKYENFIKQDQKIIEELSEIFNESN